MTNYSLGITFKSLREARGWTLAQMANALTSNGVEMKTRSGVMRLEERGTDRRAVLKAYGAIFGMTLDELETAAAKHEKIHLK